MSIKVKHNLSVPEENYIYFHHTGLKIVIPVDPISISDTMGANFSSQTPLSRTAPIYSWSSSGPRTVQCNFQVHRDLCNEYNNLGYDAVDIWIQNLDQMVLPTYNQAGKIVNPPVVSLKLRDDIFIKGIVQSTSHNFDLPIINYGGKNRYALVSLNFTVQEITPYSASIIPSIGQYRNTTGNTQRATGGMTSNEITNRMGESRGSMSGGGRMSMMTR